MVFPFSSLLTLCEGLISQRSNACSDYEFRWNQNDSKDVLVVNRRIIWVEQNKSESDQGYP